MRKLMLFVAMLTLLVLAACGNATPTVEPTPTAAEPTALPTAEPQIVGAAPGECQLTPSLFPAPKGSEWLTFAPISASDYSKGAENATLTIMEYADFTCPYCAQIGPLYDEMLEKYPDDTRFVYRHFPIGHDKSNISIQASEAANLQGKFWEMYDVLYDLSTWNTWMEMTPENFQIWVIEQAGKIGLDVDKFTEDLNSEAVIKKVNDAQSDAQVIGLRATPSIYVFLEGKLIWAINIDENDALSPSFANFEAILKLWQLQKMQYSECPPETVDASKKYTAMIQTTKGDITLELYPDKAPLTVNSFVFLAEQGWYDDVPFHRVVEGFVAQAGDPTGTGIGGPGYEFGDEISADLKFDDAGVLGMANSGPGTNGSQFFITLAAQPNLDNNYPVFGRVTSGLDVLKSLTLRDASTMTVLPEPDRIITIKITVQ